MRCNLDAWEDELYKKQATNNPGIISNSKFFISTQ